MTITIDDIIVNKYKQVIQCFKSVETENGNIVFACQIDDCEHKYPAKSSAIRHVRLNHNDFFIEIQNNKKEKQNDCSYEEFEIRVKVKPDDIWNACVDLVTINGLPLSVVEFTAFKKILEPYVISLKRHGVDLIINRHNIREKIEKRAKSVKEVIVSEARNKLVCVMIDIASRYNRSVLGVNISYFHDGKTRIRTIGMHTLRFSQTARNLKELIKKNLLDFSIKLDEQVISVTTDNGKNMIKTIALFNDDLPDGLQNEPDLNTDSEDEEHIDNSIFDDDYYEKLISEVRTLFHEINHKCLIHGVSCAAHCINLVVSHAVKQSPETSKLIERCRILAKKLRTPTFRALLNAGGFNMAKIDVATRWNSIYTMLTRLLELKTFCQSVVARKGWRDCLLTESEWKCTEFLQSVLAPFEKYTRKLQSNDVTLSDFYGYWTALRIKLAKSQDELSKNLLNEMNKFHDTLMQNPAMAGAIYLDPRYQRGLKELKPLAIEFLVHLYLKMRNAERLIDEERDTENQLFESEQNEDAEKSDSFDDMRDYLDACGSINIHSDLHSEHRVNDEDIIREKLREFDGANESLKLSIWDIWEKRKSKDVELYRLATTVFSIPPTQTTVERAFSALALILTSHRTRLNDDTLQNILLIRLNQDIYNKVANSIYVHWFY